MKIWTLLDRWTGRTASFATILPLIPPGIVAFATFHLAKTVEWVSQWGFFGWWVSALLAFTMTTIALFVTTLAREKWEMAVAAKRWGKSVTTINPLNREFHKQRIAINDLAHPVRRRISNKTFTGCELIGGANLLFGGGTELTRCVFLDCDFVIGKENSKIINAFFIEDCTLISCEISRCTIFVSQQLYDLSIKQIGVNLISYESRQI